LRSSSWLYLKTGKGLPVLEEKRHDQFFRTVRPKIPQQTIGSYVNLRIILL